MAVDMPSEAGQFSQGEQFTYMSRLGPGELTFVKAILTERNV